MKKLDELSTNLNEEIAKLKKIKKTKKTLTSKQYQALLEGRRKRAIKTKAKQFKEAIKLQKRVKGESDKYITFQTWENRIKYTMRELGITRTQAIKKVTTSRMFRTQDELFKIAIKGYAQLTDYTTIRRYIWKIIKEEAETNPNTKEAIVKGWITYNTLKISWDEFVYDEFLKALVYERNGRKILISVKHGKNSTDPDWLKIQLI